MRRLVSLAALAALLCPSPAWPTQTRRIELETLDTVVRLRCRMRYATVVALPAFERVLDFVTGDQDAWALTGAANMAYVKPLEEGAATNVMLVTEAGRIYSFHAVEAADEEPDSMVHIEYEPPEAQARPADEQGFPEPRFVSREEVAAFEAAAADAAEAARRAWREADARIEAAVEEFRSAYPTLMRFEYVLERAAAREPFAVQGMWHDGLFTYVRTQAEESPALYEERDGGPALVDFELTEDGLYVVRRVLGHGYLQAGKKRARWRRVPPRPLTPKDLVKAAPAAGEPAPASAEFAARPEPEAPGEAP